MSLSLRGFRAAMKAARQAGVLCEVSELMHLKRERERERVKRRHYVQRDVAEKINKKGRKPSATQSRQNRFKILAWSCS